MTVDPQKVFFIVNDAGQPTPVQFLKNGIPTLISVTNPIVSRLHQGRISGEGVQFYNENGEIDCGVQVDTYIFFADEDNKVRPIPPGSILQGNFKPSTSVDEHESSPCTPSPHNEKIEYNNNMMYCNEESVDTYGEDSQVDHYTSHADIELEEEIVSNSDIIKSQNPKEFIKSGNSAINNLTINDDSVAIINSKNVSGKIKKKKKPKYSSVSELEEQALANKTSSSVPYADPTSTPAELKNSPDYTLLPVPDLPVDHSQSINDDEKHVFSNQMDRLFQVAEAELIAVTSMEKKEMGNTVITSSPIFVRNDSTVSIPTVPSINAKKKFDSDDCKITVNKCETYCDTEQIFLSNAETMNTELSNDCISFCLKNKGSANVDYGNVHYGTNKGPVVIKAENETFSNCFHQNNPNTFSAIDENSNSNSAMENVNKNGNVDSCLFSNSVVDEKNFSDFDHNSELDAVIDIGASNEIYVFSKRDVNTDINKIKNDLVFKDNNGMNCSLPNKIECCLHDCTRSAVNETNGGNYSESEKHVENGADQPEDNLMTGSFLFSLTKGINNTESVMHDSLDYESKSMCDELTTLASNSKMINTEFTLHGLSCESTNYRNKNCSNDINKKQTDLESACRDNFLLDETFNENEHVNISKKGTDDEKLIELPTGMILFENTGVLEHHSLRAQQASKRRITSCEESFDRKKTCFASKHGHMEVKSINEEICNIASNANFEKVHPSNTNNVEGQENSKNKIKNNTDLAEYQHNSHKFITIKSDWSNVNVEDGDNKLKIKYDCLITKVMVVEREQEIRMKNLVSKELKFISKQRQMKINLLKWKKEKLDTELLIKNLKDELELFKAAYKKSLDEIRILSSQLKFGKKQEIDISAKSEGFQENNFCFISDISYLNQESKPKRKSQRTITKNELMRDNDEIKSSNDDKEDIKSITSVETVESSDSKISRITRRSANISKSDLLVENKLETLSLKNASAESLSKMSKTLSKKFVKDIC